MDRCRVPLAACDFDGDGGPDEQDFAILLAAFGRRADEPGFHRAPDFDDDGVITFLDYEPWVECCRHFIGDPLAPPPVGRLGDFDADNDVDLADFVRLQRCLPTPPDMSFPGIAKS